MRVKVGSRVRVRGAGNRPHLSGAGRGVRRVWGVGLPHLARCASACPIRNSLRGSCSSAWLGLGPGLGLGLGLG